MACHRDDMWSMDEKRKLTWLWGSGLSARMIAKHIRRTRNAIIGQAHRLGLAERRSPIRRTFTLKKCANPNCGNELGMISGNAQKYCSEDCKPVYIKPLPLPVCEPIIKIDPPKIQGVCSHVDCHYLGWPPLMKCYRHNGAELGA